MSPFDFITTPHITFGAGVLTRAGQIARPFGRRALIVTGRSLRHVERLTSALEQEGVTTDLFPVPHEPSVELVVAGAERAKAARIDVVVAIGGGSALDTGKAIAALAANPGDIFDYLETIGGAKSLDLPALPVVAVPTTAGTGSEATRNAVVSSPEHRVKVSLRHASMLPRAAIVDPALAVGLDPRTTAATGLDALTQLIEPYVSTRRTPIVDLLAVDGIRRVAGALRTAVARGDDLEARSDMALAATWSGMCLSNAALGAVHGLAGPLGGLLGAPHGALCAALLPHVMAVNVAAARRHEQPAILARYDEVGRLVTASASAKADDAVRWVTELAAELSIDGLAAHGLTNDGISAVIEPARRASSMKGNPVELSGGELKEILERAL